MAKTQSRFQVAILDHLNQITSEEAQEFYGLAESTIKMAKKTGKISGVFYERYMEEFGGLPAIGDQAEDAQEETVEESAEEQIEDTMTLPTESLANDPIILQIVKKINEMATVMRELGMVADGDGKRLENLESLVGGLIEQRSQPQQMRRVPLGTLPPSSAGDGYEEPEVISATRPGRASVPVIGNRRNAVPQLFNEPSQPGVRRNAGGRERHYPPAHRGTAQPNARSWIAPHIPKR